MWFPKWIDLDRALRATFPVALTFLLVLLDLLPVSISPDPTLAPMALLISIYYWSIFRPDLMPLWAVFLLSGFFDLVSGGPLGLTIFCLMLLSFSISRQRRFFYHAPFLWIWGAFALYAALVFSLILLLGSFLSGYWLDEQKMLLHYAITVSAYPLFAVVFAKIQETFLKSG